MKHCHICCSPDVEEDMACDRCEEIYCHDCSYTFSLHYQYEGSLCFWCSDQKRRNPLTKNDIRENKIRLLGI